jgi:hypothetical protein
VKVVESVCGWATSKLERCIKKYDMALIELSPEGVSEVGGEHLKQKYFNNSNF